MPIDRFTIRECSSLEDFQSCVELERQVWKDDDIDIMPVRLYKICKTCNAPTFGAFDEEGRLVGFGHTMIALIDGHLAYHSHMLAVREELRDQQIGHRIKLAQRKRAIESGVELIFWTFDPLQSRNAHLNVNKLGAIVRSYEDNYYGIGVSTGFDAEVPTDRLIAEWWVSSDHVASALEGSRPRVDDPGAIIEIPDNINEIRLGSVEEHLRWRLKVREEFKKALATGNIARGFTRDGASGSSRYLFGPDDKQFHFESVRG